MEENADATVTRRQFGARHGVGMAGVILGLVITMGAILLFMGLWKRFARETVPRLVDLPSGPWLVGGVLGVITVLGVAGALRCMFDTSHETRLARRLRAAATALCCVPAFGPLFYLLSALPGKNCRSSNCAYIPGTGSAFLSYAVSVGLVGWLCYRWRDARTKEDAARERERMRKLRKKGRGKSREAKSR